MTDSYPSAFAHDPIEAIADDVFMVRGSIRMNFLMRITRNMAIVRDGSSLTLINPVRLNAAEEDALRALGTVKHVIRLGPFHGLDDPYYVDQFGAKFWCQPGGKAYKRPDIDVPLDASSRLPFPDARLIPIEGCKQPEAFLLLQRGNGILLTCDALQHYGDYRHNNLPARLVMPFIGFPKTTVVGPIWLKYMTPAGASLQAELRRVLDYDFDSLLSAHGSYLRTDAKASVRAAIQRAFPVERLST